MCQESKRFDFLYTLTYSRVSAGIGKLRFDNPELRLKDILLIVDCFLYNIKFLRDLQSFFVFQLVLQRLKPEGN